MNDLVNEGIKEMIKEYNATESAKKAVDDMQSEVGQPSVVPVNKTGF